MLRPILPHVQRVQSVEGANIMKSKISSKWVEAACVLAKDPDAKVKCPSCERAILEVHDVPYEKEPAVFERYLTCHACGARNVMRINRGKDEGPKAKPETKPTGSCVNS
jgi:hypothetical protein